MVSIVGHEALEFYRLVVGERQSSRALADQLECMKVTIKISPELFDELVAAAFEAEEFGEDLTPEDYVRECIHAGLWRDRKANLRRQQSRGVLGSAVCA